MWIQILFTKKSFKQGNSSQYKLQLSCRYKVKRCKLQIQARQDTDFLQQMIYFFPQNIFKFSLLLQLPQILRKIFWIKFDLVIIEPLVQNLFIITYLFQSLYIIEPEKKTIDTHYILSSIQGSTYHQKRRNCIDSAQFFFLNGEEETIYISKAGANNPLIITCKCKIYM